MFCFLQKKNKLKVLIEDKWIQIISLKRKDGLDKHFLHFFIRLFIQYSNNGGNLFIRLMSDTSRWGRGGAYGYTVVKARHSDLSCAMVIRSCTGLSPFLHVCKSVLPLTISMSISLQCTLKGDSTSCRVTWSDQTTWHCLTVASNSLKGQYHTKHLY